MPLLRLKMASMTISMPNTAINSYTCTQVREWRQLVIGIFFSLTILVFSPSFYRVWSCFLFSLTCLLESTLTTSSYHTTLLMFIRKSTLVLGICYEFHFFLYCTTLLVHCLISLILLLYDSLWLMWLCHHYAWLIRTISDSTLILHGPIPLV